MAEVPRPGPDPRAGGGGGGGGTTDHRLLTNRDDAAEHPAAALTFDTTGLPGGTGATVQAVGVQLVNAQVATDAALIAQDDALQALGTTYTDLIGDGAEDEITVTHNLDTTALLVSLIDLSATPDEGVLATWTVTDSNNIVVHFDSPPATDSIRVTIFGKALA